jgi:serine/threonine protein phosphatase PrpC
VSTSSPVPRSTGPEIALSWGACTDPGERGRNEDGHLAERPVFLVADGMGGHARGEAASSAVVAAFRPLTGADWGSAADLRRAITAASDKVDALARDGACPGSTVAGVMLTHEGGQAYWLVFNIGDSRVYLFSGDQLEQVSIDHSRVQELVDIGEMSAQRARDHRDRNVITRALGAGIRGAPEPDQWLVKVVAGDRLVICSDGLTTEVTDPLIAATLLSVGDAAAAARELVNAALTAGGRDNVTVVVIDVLGAPPTGDVSAYTTEITLDLLPKVDLDAPTMPARRTGESRWSS